jgi:hypothetical protein
VDVKPDRSIRLLPVACIALLAASLSMGQEGGEDGGSKPEISVDTLGKLSGHMLTLTRATTHEWFSRGNERYETEFTLSIRVPDKETGPKAMQDEFLLGWASSEFGNGIEAPTPPKIEAKKNTVKIFCGPSPAEFRYGKGGFILSPDFKKAVARNLDKPENPYAIGCLQELLAGSSLADAGFRNTLRLYVIRDSIRAGFLDASLDSLAGLSGQAANEEPPDEATRRYCKRLTDSLLAAKKNMQPIKLEGAKKLGKIVADPIYPPLDKPTVFWRGDLLAVVQEDSKPIKMRTFDPKTGKWEKAEPVRYPETVIAELYAKEAGGWDSECPNETYCWRKALGDPGADPCDGLDCEAPIMLKDAGGGSVSDIENRKRAGGVSTAGEGKFEFIGQGMLYKAGDGKVGWALFPENTLCGSREYKSGAHASPPVVVSPDQKWIAYALAAKQGDTKELWVAKLVYKE